jgi:hypothetical protein
MAEDKKDFWGNVLKGVMVAGAVVCVAAVVVSKATKNDPTIPSASELEKLMKMGYPSTVRLPLRVSLWG